VSIAVSTRHGAPAKRRKNQRGTSRSKQPASSRARAKPTNKKKPKQSAARPAAGLGKLFDGHGHDVWGIALLGLSILLGLGVYLASAGPVGRALAATAGSLVGVLRYLLPPALAVIGVILIRGTPEPSDDRDTDEADVHLARRRQVMGAVLVTFSVAGLLHVIAAPPSLDVAGIDAFSDAGGLLGALIAAPLTRLLSQIGAGVVLALVALLAASLLTGRSLATLWRSGVEVLGPLLRTIATGFSDLFTVGDEAKPEATAPEVSVGGEGRVALFDQDEDGEDLPAPKKSRKKKRKQTEPQLVLPPEPISGTEANQLEINLGPGVEGSPWKLPSPSLLSLSGNQEVDADAVRERGHRLEAALSQHGVQTRLVGMVVGPTVTRYELELGVGVKVNSVVNLSKDIAYSMASPDVRIIAPIPGKQAIGVEVPNTKRQIVALGDILASPAAHRATHPLEVAVGRDIEGESVMVNLATMPHILIAGQTGAGKSSCINSLMTSILMRATPEQVRMILVDPKRVELTQYNRVPHLLTQVVTNPKKAANALAWAVKEMERRYELLEEVAVRDVTGYNAAFDRGELTPEEGALDDGSRKYQRLPLILVVVDELADLMMVAARDVEESINRIAAKARAVGVHLVIATQRPSVNVITGVIKANIPARFAFSVASATDSKVILDSGGAERLVGQGDMLVVGPSSGVPNRVQGCWVEEKEVAKVVSHWRRQSPDTHYIDEIVGEENLKAVGSGATNGASDDDELLMQAMELVVQSGLGSTSMLQRKLKVGFARAGRLMDLLEQRGVVGPSEGSKARTVLMSAEEFHEIQTNV
jgi:S-DNA-T family DNA segregation ATPase FtsK/SpoIIIE